MAVFVVGMNGLGDNLFQRPWIAGLTKSEEVYLQTPWPEVYRGIDVKLVKPRKNFMRTQLKNVNRSSVVWETPPKHARTITLEYDTDALRAFNIMQHIGNQLGLVTFDTVAFHLPRFGFPDQVKSNSKPIAVIRPATVRTEWACPTRNPEPKYLAWCSRELMNLGYHVVSIADTELGVETIVMPEPPAHQKFHQGELSVPEIIGLCQVSKQIVTGSGMMLVIGAATQSSMFVIFGGRGSIDSPAKVFDPRMGLNRVSWALPDRFCRCSGMVHGCDKEIHTLPEQFYQHLTR